MNGVRTLARITVTLASAQRLGVRRASAAVLARNFTILNTRVSIEGFVANLVAACLRYGEAAP
jgi:hypothetical protein